jgi:hypothetical protein
VSKEVERREAASLVAVERSVGEGGAARVTIVAKLSTRERTLVSWSCCKCRNAGSVVKRVVPVPPTGAGTVGGGERGREARAAVVGRGGGGRSVAGGGTARPV